MADPTARRRRSSALFPVVGVLLAVFGFGGAGLLTAAYSTEPDRPPTPSANTLAVPAPAAGQAAALPASVPVRVDIDAINVHAPIQGAGTDATGAVAVPPLDQPYLTYWYNRGVTPGEIGNSVILGHVDSYQVGPAVFFYLGGLKTGAKVEVTRQDGTVATFQVDGVALFAKDKFPSDLVYGANDRPSLRLITCGGSFDTQTRDYAGDTVVTATLVSSRMATGTDQARPLRTFIPNLATPLGESTAGR